MKRRNTPKWAKKEWGQILCVCVSVCWALRFSPDGRWPRGQLKKRWMDRIKDMKQVKAAPENALDRKKWKVTYRNACDSMGKTLGKKKCVCICVHMCMRDKDREHMEDTHTQAHWFHVFLKTRNITHYNWHVNSQSNRIYLNRHTHIHKPNCRHVQTY